MNGTNLETAISAYLAAARWTNDDMEGGLSPGALSSAKLDLLRFQSRNADTINRAGIDSTRVGHDLWLTRNGHDTGFWDRGLGEAGDILTRAAENMGETDLYAGDDGLLYFSR